VGGKDQTNQINITRTLVTAQSGCGDNNNKVWDGFALTDPNCLSVLRQSLAEVAQLWIKAWCHATFCMLRLCRTWIITSGVSRRFPAIPRISDLKERCMGAIK
jgi:hypothetical protein